MITKEDVIALVDRNESIGKQTTGTDLNLIRDWYREIYNDKYTEYKVGKREKFKKGTSCGACVTNMLNSLRFYVDYPPIVKSLSKKISTNRIEICKLCEHSQGKGFLTTCGTPIIGNSTNEGELCGCFVYAKAQLKNEECPLKKW
mgnify:CR=1 FL=1